MDIGKKFLSELKLYSDYLKWNDSENRYETWEEACKDVLNVHITKYGNKVESLIQEVLPSYINKEFLASQRTLQFRNEQLLKNNCRQYNCSVSYAYSPDIFRKGFFMLLSGAGFGINLGKKYTKQFPNIHKRSSDTITYIIPDSIEGWCEAANVLISSYCLHKSLNSEFFGRTVRFDYSKIREEGSFISGGFKAPGHKGLKDSLEKIELYLEKLVETEEVVNFSSYSIYNIFMHLSNAVLSGGIRRSAQNIIFDRDDIEMINAKTGNWREKNPQFARSNNSVGLLKNSFTKEEFNYFLKLNEGDNDCGFVLQESENQLFNPCYEIGFDFYDQIKDYTETVIQMCNLCEINASACKTEKDFLRICRNAAIVGTLQAGYTDFPYLGKQTEDIVRGEALLGISITGWMDNPSLFNPELLKKGAEVVKYTNEEVAKLLGINAAARTTCVKPSGNASVILGTASGIHPEHSNRYFRIMQINKESEVLKWLLNNYPQMVEKSQWSATGTDYVVFVPIELTSNAITKDKLIDIDHIKKIELVQENWVKAGANPKTAYNPNINHNVSNTIIIDNFEDIADYIFEHQENFVAVSFLSRFGDKDFNQAPFTSILNDKELFEKYGNGVLFTSGLITDGLNYFNNNLWQACDSVLNKEIELIGTHDQILLQKDWIRRVKKFSKNYLGNDLKNTIYCIKDVYLYHKWCTVKRVFNSEKKLPKLSELLPKPSFVNIDSMGAISCSGGACEINFDISK
jgi:ribonucleoside-triphosphate reductase